MARVLEILSDVTGGNLTNGPTNLGFLNWDDQCWEEKPNGLLGVQKL